MGVDAVWYVRDNLVESAHSDVLTADRLFRSVFLRVYPRYEWPCWALGALDRLFFVGSVEWRTTWMDAWKG